MNANPTVRLMEISKSIKSFQSLLSPSTLDTGLIAKVGGCEAWKLGLAYLWLAVIYSTTSKV